MLKDSHRVLILLCSNEVQSESSKWTNSNSPCGASEEEEEVTLWVKAHGKQDFLFVCYGVMGGGDLSISFCTLTYIYFQNQLLIWSDLFGSVQYGSVGFDLVLVWI